jgi:hypothetical protein
MPIYQIINLRLRQYRCLLALEMGKPHWRNMQIRLTVLFTRTCSRHFAAS